MDIQNQSLFYPRAIITMHKFIRAVMLYQMKGHSVLIPREEYKNAANVISSVLLANFL